jgi:hypothetical protein
MPREIHQIARRGQYVLAAARDLATAARPKWPYLASADRYRSCLSVIMAIR